MRELNIFILTVICSIAPVSGRVFENHKGQKIDAKYISSTNTHVTLRLTKNFKTYTIPLASLTQKDQDYISNKIKTQTGSNRYKSEFTEWSTEKSQIELNGKIRGLGKGVLPNDANKPINRELYPRSKSEIAKSISAIDRAAQSQSQFSEGQQEAVAALNTYRYLCGLPCRVTLDKRLCEGSEKAANGCAKIGRLSHDVNNEAGKCNLGWGPVGSAVDDFMNDPGESNREHRAHRQWCLSPKLGKVGFGRSGRANEDKNRLLPQNRRETETFSKQRIQSARQTMQINAMWVQDDSGPNPRYADNFFAYPSRGFFPTEYLKRGTAWSVYFPKGKVPSKGQIELKVFEIGKEFKGVPSEKFDPPNSTEVKINYLSTSNWVMPCINFEPATNVAPGKRYWVRVKAGRAKISYLVEFY